MRPHSRSRSSSLALPRFVREYGLRVEHVTGGSVDDAHVYLRGAVTDHDKASPHQVAVRSLSTSGGSSSDGAWTGMVV